MILNCAQRKLGKKDKNHESDSHHDDNIERKDELTEDCCSKTVAKKELIGMSAAQYDGLLGVSSAKNEEMPPTNHSSILTPDQVRAVEALPTDTKVGTWVLNGRITSNNIGILFEVVEKYFTSMVILDRSTGEKRLKEGTHDSFLSLATKCLGELKGRRRRELTGKLMKIFFPSMYDNIIASKEAEKVKRICDQDSFREALRKKYNDHETINVGDFSVEKVRIFHFFHPNISFMTA